MADADLAAPLQPQTPLELIRENFNRLSAKQKLAGAVAIALSVALLAAVWMWSKQPNYAVLFSGLEEKDGGAIITALQAQNVPYKVADGNGAILVPAQQVAELRLRMASQGLPRGGSVGFELMDNERLGVSQFAEQVTYQRALEGELGRTVASLAQVREARVHLAIPKQTAFLRDEQKPTASVMLSLHSGRTLEPAQLAGIVHLVSSSVPQLSPEAVSIIDQSGKLLTSGGARGRHSGLDPAQLEYIADVEQRYMQRIESILEPIVGQNNLRAQVTAEIDFDQQEQTAESYKPNPSPDQAIRSQQTADNSQMQPGPVGVPGALSNQPPVPATAPITAPPLAGASAAAAGATPLSASRSATTNYELDKTVQHVKRSVGQVKRLAVAVVVNHKSERDKKGELKSNPLSAAEMAQINALVREAMGYNEKRGDSLNIANAPFSLPQRDETPLATWQDPELRKLALEIGRWLMLALVALFLWLRVLRPLVRTVAPVVVEPTAEELAAAEAAEEEDAAKAKLKLAEAGEIADEDLLPPEVRAEEIARMSFDKKIAKAREIAVKNPKVIANLLKEWMGTTNNERR